MATIGKASMCQALSNGIVCYSGGFQKHSTKYEITVNRTGLHYQSASLSGRSPSSREVLPIVTRIKATFNGIVWRGQTHRTSVLSCQAGGGEGNTGTGEREAAAASEKRTSSSATTRGAKAESGLEHPETSDATTGAAKAEYRNENPEEGADGVDGATKVTLQEVADMEPDKSCLDTWVGQQTLEAAEAGIEMGTHPDDR